MSNIKLPTSILVLLRHGQSEWNLANRFTGWQDVDLSPRGIEEAREAGRKLKNLSVKFDQAFTSKLSRAQKTLDLALEEMGIELPTERDEALNERDYGDLVGQNKDEAREKFGEEQVRIWRRSFDVAPPNGESLKDTADRTLPYFNEKIMSEVKAGKNILMSAHGNSLRAIAMQLDNLSPEEVVKLEIPTGVPLVYEIDETGKVVSKKILS
ncbi:2,3-bisphosphoglycerate-dependent phosphoglycerate mutase [Candidatus Gracilibacteria bacterium]|nr:2,3-bisphosphoglycerate-dependent phosphoglycerate mutase [Candidatus Gracilibacteria bacterium]MCF7856751.1 2,3-bisphosphoglycerate-dependent phosphoglycerate mutase [Candidatus Gracilibacteria bacterium]MCF7897043.1 2,3-bisphosphoglycerate-dependent phosphoglycerate mutase [Candidatus Gracilibacteria bacterium]